MRALTASTACLCLLFAANSVLAQGLTPTPPPSGIGPSPATPAAPPAAAPAPPAANAPAASAPTPALFELFMRGQRLNVSSASKNYAFDLTNAGAVLADLIRCVQDYAGPPPAAAIPFAFR